MFQNLELVQNFLVREKKYTMHYLVFDKNKKSHWLQASAIKLLEDKSGKIEMPMDFLDKNCWLQIEKVSTTIEFCIFELVYRQFSA